jgi:endonuclease III related protein
MGKRSFELMRRLLLDIYERLYGAFGPRHWWPGETPFEVMVGAILTQNTSWTNVEKAIRRLKEEGRLTASWIHQLKKKELASLIRSSGTYRVKADRLRAFTMFFFERYDGKIPRMKMEPLHALRERLLEVKGVGPETADSILLYALEKPVFVVDAYTKRIFSRHGITSEKASYGEVQKLFMDHLPADEKLFNEYHALLVHLGKRICQKIPKCDICPIKSIARSAKRIAEPPPRGIGQNA